MPPTRRAATRFRGKATSFESAGGLDLAANPDGSGATFAFGYWHGDANEASVKFGQLSTSGPLDPKEPIKRAGLPGASAVAILKDGSSVIASSAFDHWESDYNSYVARFSAAGERQGELIHLGATDPTDDITSASIDAIPDGGFVVTFVHSTVSKGQPVGDLYLQRFATDGTAEQPGAVAIPVAPTSGAVVEVDRTGSAVVLYRDEGTGSLRFLCATSNFTALDGVELYVHGTESPDHIIVERVGERLWVSVNGVVQGYDAADVQFLSISAFGGDDDVINASGMPSTISGGDGHDTLWGGSGADQLRGFGGNDSLRGGDGDDALFGDTGSDALNGGDDNDLLLGDTGEDTLLGSTGNDLLLGHRGSDSLYGEAGNDVLLGGDADDYLEGGAGHDELYGQAGRDALFGLTGNDRLFANDGAADTVRGSLGDDSGILDDEDDVLDVESLA